MSGASMSAPVVAGTAALMIQANPTLTPDQVRAILMDSAQPIPGLSVFEQGAGRLNAEGAVKIALLGDGVLLGDCHRLGDDTRAMLP